MQYLILHIKRLNSRHIMLRPGTTAAPMRRYEGTSCHAGHYRHLTFEEPCQIEIPGKSELSRGLDCATPGTHLRSDCILTEIRQGVALQTEIGEMIESGFGWVAIFPV